MAAECTLSREKSVDRDEFIEQNLKLVHSLAHRYTGRGIDYDDLYSAGCVGLVKAYDGFDESRGFNFSTYAVPVILGEIRRLFRDGGDVKVSRSVKEMSQKLVKIRSELEHRLMRSPTISELASELGISPEEAAVALDAALPAVSLTADNDDDENRSLDLSDGFSDEDLVGKIALTQAVNELESLDREIIRLRYFCDFTQLQTAKQLNMTQVAVSRREKKILTKLRRNLV